MQRSGIWGGAEAGILGWGRMGSGHAWGQAGGSRRQGEDLTLVLNPNPIQRQSWAVQICSANFSGTYPSTPTGAAVPLSRVRGEVSSCFRASDWLPETCAGYSAEMPVHVMCCSSTC